MITKSNEEDGKGLVEGVKHVDPKTVRPEFFIIIINSNQMANGGNDCEDDMA